MSFIKSRSHYFSLPSILASQERIPCTFNRSVSFLGGLDPRSDSSVVEQGTKLEIPYWLAKVFIEDEATTFEYPKVYGEMYRDILKADASVVDLFKLAKYFYECGKLLSFLPHTDADELCNTLIQAFIHRFRQLSDWAQAQSQEVGPSDRLECLERTLLLRAHIANSKLTNWLTRGVGTIRTAELVSIHNRRKKLAEEYRIFKK